MRIGAQFFGLDRTGGTLVLLRYLERAIDAGHQVDIATLGRSGDPRFVPPPSGATTNYVGLRGRAYRGLARLMPGDLAFPDLELRRLRDARQAADVRLASYSFTVLSSVGDAPVHHHVQHYEALLEPTPRRKRLIDEALRADVYRTANCTWVANRVDEVGGAVHGVVAPGLDLDVFSPNGVPVDETPLARRPIRVLTLGKRVAWKGLRDVVSATELVARSRAQGVELVSYGPDQPASPSGVEAHHHGFVDSISLARLYRSADVCVSASWYESFPLPPLEAMACGTPVICTRLGTEDYAEHEVNCLIVPAEDPTAIADAIRRLAADVDLRAELVARGLHTAQRFTWERAESAFLEHLARAAGLDSTVTI